MMALTQRLEAPRVVRLLCLERIWTCQETYPGLPQVVTAPIVARPGAAKPARASLRRSSERDVTYATSNPNMCHEACRDNTRRAPCPQPRGRRRARRGIGDYPCSDALF